VRALRPTTEMDGENEQRSITLNLWILAETCELYAADTRILDAKNFL